MFSDDFFVSKHRLFYLFLYSGALKNEMNREKQKNMMRVRVETKVTDDANRALGWIERTMQ